MARKNKKDEQTKFSPLMPHPAFLDVELGAGFSPVKAIKVLRRGYYKKPGEEEKIPLDLAACDAAFDSVYAEPFDGEDEDHLYFMRWVRVARETISLTSKTADMEKVKAEEERLLGIGREYFKAQGIDPETVGKEALLEIAKLIPLAGEEDAAPAEQEEATLIRRDDETMCLVTPDGNIIGFLDAPNFGVDEREKWLTWVGEKLTDMEAKKAGIVAEQQHWLQKIDKVYRPQINSLQRRIDYLRYRYTPMAETYMREIYDKSKDTPHPITNSKVGLLILQLTSTKSSVDVIMESRAVLWLRKRKLFAAIKTEESVLKTPIPEEVKREMNDDPNSGMRFNPGGERKFTMG